MCDVSFIAGLLWVSYISKNNTCCAPVIIPPVPHDCHIAAAPIEFWAKSMHESPVCGRQWLWGHITGELLSGGHSLGSPYRVDLFGVLNTAENIHGTDGNHNGCRGVTAWELLPWGEWQTEQYLSHIQWPCRVLCLTCLLYGDARQVHPSRAAVQVKGRILSWNKHKGEPTSRTVSKTDIHNFTVECENVCKRCIKLSFSRAATDQL
jgi:hypothetical protein